MCIYVCLWLFRGFETPLFNFKASMGTGNMNFWQINDFKGIFRKYLWTLFSLDKLLWAPVDIYGHFVDMYVLLWVF